MHRSITFTTTDVIADRNGIYVIVTGTLFSTPVVLANVYAPNYDHHLIIGGDFNKSHVGQIIPEANKCTAKVLNNFETMQSQTYGVLLTQLQGCIHFFLMFTKPSLILIIFF